MLPRPRDRTIRLFADEFGLQQADDRLLEEAEHQAVHVGNLGGTLRDEGLDQRVNLLVIAEDLVQEQLVVSALCVVDHRLHIKNNGHIGAGAALRDVLGMELAWPVNDQLFFLQIVVLSFHRGKQGSPIYVGEFKVIVFLPLKMIAGVADGVVVAQNFADPDPGKDPLKHVRRA